MIALPKSRKPLTPALIALAKILAAAAVEEFLRDAQHNKDDEQEESANHKQ